MAKKRVLAVLVDYPQLSQTYKENELVALYSRYEVKIVSVSPPETPYAHHLPYTAATTYGELEREIHSFRPDVIHGHYVTTTDALHRAAEMSGRPYTVRTHSFDVLVHTEKTLEEFGRYMRASACIGVLAFPFLRPILEKYGIQSEKIIDCMPVVDYARFHDESPNGKAIMNTGAVLRKKNMRAFVALAKEVPERTFNLYPIGYATPDLTAYNEDCGRPVNILPTVEPFDMPREYKKHEWLVYTANPQLPTVGWPMAVAEAQAAGVGVCMQNVRPDLADYVGEAGYLFDSLEQVRDIVSQPFPEEKRRLGFRQAKRSDIFEHIADLERCWERSAFA